MADCGYHPGRDAVGACVACGKMVCTECRTVLGGKIYCQPCADEIFVKKKSGGPSPTGVTKAAPVAEEKLEGYWWLLVIFLVWVGGLITWALNKDRAPEAAKQMLWWGIGFTFIWPAFWWFVGQLF